MPKGSVAAKLAEIYTVCLHNSYTAKNWHIIRNKNNRIRKFYHSLRMTVFFGWMYGSTTTATTATAKEPQTPFGNGNRKTKDA